MDERRLGRTGPMASAIGLGCMGMSGTYGAVDREESIKTIHAALEAGVTLLDTGDFYGMGDNELLVGEALAARPGFDALVSVKFGAQRGPDGAWLGYDARPEAVKTSLAYSLRRLGRDHVDIYRPARLDPKVPIEETVGAIGELIEAGYVRYVGLSEVGVETLRRAQAVWPVVDLQIEYSLLSRSLEPSVLPTCRELGIAVTAYGVLSRGLLSGHWASGRIVEEGDFRSRAPRFTKDNLAANLELVAALGEVAEDLGLTTAQLALAWVLDRGEDIVVLVGAKTRDRLGEALGALDVRLSPADLERVEGAVPAGSAAGDRYPAAQMDQLDSERS